MIDELFYPELTRRAEYSIKSDSSYYIYSYYYREIEEDCKSRCIYCDAKKHELGGDKLQLDHFRPQQLFSDKKNDPNNLVLSCPKCNRLKSQNWPFSPDSDIKESHNSEVGFIDPFVESQIEFYSIDATGGITSKKAPAEYLIKLLKLDRESRTLLRKRRIILEQMSDIAETIEKKMIDIIEKLSRKGEIDHEDRESLIREATLIQKLNTMQKEAIYFIEGPLNAQ